MYIEAYQLHTHADRWFIIAAPLNASDNNHWPFLLYQGYGFRRSAWLILEISLEAIDFRLITACPVRANPLLKIARPATDTDGTSACLEPARLRLR